MRGDVNEPHTGVCSPSSPTGSDWVSVTSISLNDTARRWSRTNGMSYGLIGGREYFEYKGENAEYTWRTRPRLVIYVRV